LPNTGITLGQGKQPSLSSTEDLDSGRPAPPAGRLLIRAGFGVQARVTPQFAIQPEFTYVGPPSGNTGTAEYIAVGLGFCIGPLPY
jgi:hypothetical protein